jgi:thioredoxin 1
MQTHILNLKKIESDNIKMVRNYAELEITDTEFERIINNSHKLVVVDFFAEWCMPCLMMTPILEDLSEQIEDVRFAKINIEDNEELAEKFKISTIPCLIIFKDGKEISRITGAHSAEVIENKIKGLLE